MDDYEPLDLSEFCNAGSELMEEERERPKRVT